MLGLLCPVVGHTQGGELDIEVRAEVERPFRGLGRAPVKEHGKIYQIASIIQNPSNNQLVRPVNEHQLLDTLREVLSARGFSEASAEAPPEIILTVLYGRGWLRNPYLDDVMTHEATGTLPRMVHSHGMPTNMARQKNFRHEEKLQAAQAEKLFIYIAAWANPNETAADEKRGKKARPRRLWTTNIILDYPNERDLNVFMREMLTAGSAYFDRNIEAEEVTLRTPMPKGRVILGPLHFADGEESAERENSPGK